MRGWLVDGATAERPIRIKIHSSGIQGCCTALLVLLNSTINPLLKIYLRRSLGEDYHILKYLMILCAPRSTSLLYAIAHATSSFSLVGTISNEDYDVQLLPANELFVIYCSCNRFSVPWQKP